MIAISFVLMIALNFLKSEGNINISKKTFNGNLTQSYIDSHHADILYGAAAGMGLIDDHTITFFDRAKLSIGFILDFFIPPKYVPDRIEYPHIIVINTSIGGGGLAIMGAYMMWGHLGVMLFGFILGEYMRKAYVCRRTPQNIIAFVVFIFFPRWLSYDFYIILRFPIMAIIIYYFLRLCIPEKRY
jgi:hypothetical protein